MEKNNSINKMITVLNLFLKSERLRIRDICEMTGFTRPAVNRIVVTLVESNYLQKDQKTKEYYLGNMIYFLGAKTNVNQNIVQKVKPILEEFSNQVGYTVSISTISDHLATVVVKKGSSINIGLVPGVSEQRSVHCCASGKILTAFSENKEDILANTKFTKITDYTITSKKEYTNELAKVKNQGYAFDDEELADGLFCIAVPILHDGYATYSISMSGYKKPITENLDHYIAVVKNYANVVANLLY